MKNRLIIVSKMNCEYLAKQLAEKNGYVFCNLADIISFDLGNIEDFKKLNGEDYFRKKETQYLKTILEYDNCISFVSYDIFKHNLDINFYKDTFIVLLDFGYFIKKGNEIVRMTESIRYQKAKSLCDEIIKCQNVGEDKILKDLKRILNEK